MDDDQKQKERMMIEEEGIRSKGEVERGWCEGERRSLKEEALYGGGKVEKRSKKEREGDDDQEGICDRQEGKRKPLIEERGAL